jgi:hypothetical protein
MSRGSVRRDGRRALSVTGSEESYESNRGNLPEAATVWELRTNRNQFGSYRGRRGDDPSNVSDAAAYERLANVTVPWFRSQ